MNSIEQKNNNKIKCRSHPKNDILYIQVNELKDNKSLFYCETCISKDQNFKPWNFVSVNQILNSETNSIVFYWPPLADPELTSKIIDLDDDNKDTPINNQIDEYFDNLKKSVIERIEKNRQIAKNIAEEVLQFDQQIHQHYQEAAKINLFKQILQETEQEFNDKEKQCRHFIQEFQHNKEINTLDLQELFNKKGKIKERVDFAMPNKIQEILMTLIDKISILKPETEGQEDESDQEEKQNQKKIFENTLIDDDESIPLTKQQKDYTKGVNNNSNNSALDLSQISHLNERQIKMIQKLINYYSQSNSDEIQTNEIKESKWLQQFNFLLQSKMNYLSKEFQSNFQQHLIDTYPILENIDLDGMYTDIEKFKAVSQIDYKLQENILKLVAKKQELSENSSFNHSQSYRVQNKLTHLYIHFNQKEFQQLLNDYPIFDLLKPIVPLYTVKDILPEIELIKYKHDQENSKQIMIEKSKQDNSITIFSNQNKQWGYFYSNIILDRKQKYIFRFKVTNVGIQNQESYLGFGLVRDQQKDNSYCYSDDLSCSLCYFNNTVSINESIPGITNKIQGSFKDLNQDQEFELIVSIGERILEFSDFPMSQHKSKLIQQFQNNLTNYQNLRFFIGIDGQIEIKITAAFIQND